MSLDPIFDAASPGRGRSLFALLAAGLLLLPVLPALAGFKKQAEAPPVTNEAQLRAVTEQGVQRMMQAQQQGPGGPGAPPPGPPRK